MSPMHRYFTAAIVAVFAAAALVVLLAGCAWNSPRRNGTPQVPHRLTVITTLFPLYDFARAVGGDRVDVTLLLPPGVEPHSFEPSPKDVATIARANLFVYVGDFMEVWVPRVLDGVRNNALTVLAAGNGLDTLADDDEDAQASGGHDPHVWLDPTNAARMATAIAEDLERLDPTGKGVYQTRAAAYVSAMDALDADLRNGLSACRTRTVVQGGHYAFGYFAQRYHLTYRAAQGFSPDAEPTAKDLASLVDTVKRDGLTAVFSEELVNPQIADILAQETGVRVLMLNAGHNVSRDDLARGRTFIDVMHTNLQNLQIGLQCHL